MHKVLVPFIINKEKGIEIGCETVKFAQELLKEKQYKDCRIEMLECKEFDSAYEQEQWCLKHGGYN